MNSGGNSMSKGIPKNSFSILSHGSTSGKLREVRMEVDYTIGTLQEEELDLLISCQSYGIICNY